MVVNSLNKEIAKRIEIIKKCNTPIYYKKQDDFIIPNEWDIVHLGNMMDFKNGLNYGKNDIGEEIKILGVGDFKTNFYLDTNDLKKIECSNFDENYLLENGDLIFVRSNGNKELIGRVLYCDNIEEKVTYSGFTIRGRVKSNDFIDKYCAYYCSSNLVRKQYMKNGGGTNINNLSQGILSNIEITKPSTKEQMKMVKIISTFDRLIELKEKFLQEKQKQKKGLMERLLSGKVRLSGFNKTWNKVKINKILNVRNEKSEVTEKLELYSLTIEDGVTPKSDRYNREFLVKNDDKKYKVTKYNDIVYNPANLRFGAIALNKVETSVLLSPIYETLYVQDNNKYDIDFIASILTSERQIRKFSTMAEGTLVERMAVKIKDFTNFKINIPNDINEQKAIAKIINTSQKEIDLLKEEIESLKEQKKGLMQLLLTGIVRVKCD
ncbi:hypothetical protein FDB34_12915 [Clostridium botulinum]|nr:hypothetical protein [Clostridium botulinum]